MRTADCGLTFSLNYFEYRRDVAEFQPITITDDASAADFERNAVDIGSVAAGSVRQEKIAFSR